MLQETEEKSLKEHSVSAEETSTRRAVFGDVQLHAAVTKRTIIKLQNVRKLLRLELSLTI